MTRYIDLAEYLWLAERVTDVRAETLSQSSRVDLADSALHAPMASFDDEEFYPEIGRQGSGALLATRSQPPPA